MNKVEAQLVAVTLRQQVSHQPAHHSTHHVAETHHSPASLRLAIDTTTDKVSITEYKKFDRDVEHPNLSILAAADLLDGFRPGDALIDQVSVDGELLWEA